MVQWLLQVWFLSYKAGPGRATGGRCAVDWPPARSHSCEMVYQAEGRRSQVTSLRTHGQERPGREWALVVLLPVHGLAALLSAPTPAIAPWPQIRYWASFNLISLVGKKWGNTPCIIELLGGTSEIMYMESLPLNKYPINGKNYHFASTRPPNGWKITYILNRSLRDRRLLSQAICLSLTYLGLWTPFPHLLLGDGMGDCKWGKLPSWSELWREQAQVGAGKWHPA